MKYVISFLLGLSILSTNLEMFAQDSLIHNTIFPEGITLEYGIGSYAVTDEYISKEKYSGTLPFYSVKWTNRHDSYVYQVGIEFRSSSQIKNNNVSTEIFQFTLNQGFLYPLPEFSLFSKKTYAYIGPSTEVFVFYNNQIIAVSGFDYAQSFAVLLSLGLNSEIYYPLTSSINIEGSLNFSVLSLGLRMVDNEETDESPAKLLTLFSGVNGLFRLGMRYYLFDNLSVKTSYLAGFTRISVWNPLRSASDNLIFTLTYGF